MVNGLHARHCVKTSLHLDPSVLVQETDVPMNHLPISRTSATGVCMHQIEKNHMLCQKKMSHRKTNTKKSIQRIQPKRALFNSVRTQFSPRMQTLQTTEIVFCKFSFIRSCCCSCSCRWWLNSTSFAKLAHRPSDCFHTGHVRY